MDERRSPRDEGPGKIGEILLGAGLITRDQLRRALALQQAEGGRLGHLLVDREVVDPEALAEALAHQLGMPLFDLAGWDLDPKVAHLLPSEVCEHQRVLPLKVRDGTLTLAMADPFDELARRRAAAASGCEVKVVLATAPAIQARVAELRRQAAGRAGLRAELAALGDRDRKRRPAPPVDQAV